MALNFKLNAKNNGIIKYLHQLAVGTRAADADSVHLVNISDCQTPFQSSSKLQLRLSAHRIKVNNSRLLMFDRLGSEIHR